MNSLVELRRNLLQRVYPEADIVQNLSEVIFITQCAEYTTGPDGKPAKTITTNSLRAEFSVAGLDAIMTALQSFREELAAIEALANEHAEAIADVRKEEAERQAGGSDE